MGLFGIFGSHTTEAYPWNSAESKISIRKRS